MTDLNEADVLSFDWTDKAKQVLSNAARHVTAEKRPELRAGKPNGKPYKVPDNFLYNVLSNPDLNNGLENLLESVGDVVFGKPSGILAIDMGLSNAPVVGPLSMLATGGVPGLVDVAGAGELRNMKKIPKYTFDFVKEFFGDKGLKNLDNALSRYPKADKPSVNDAVYILRNGLGGEQVAATKPYRGTDVVEDLYNAVGLKELKYGDTPQQDMQGWIQSVIKTAEEEYPADLRDRALKEVKALTKALDDKNLQKSALSWMWIQQLDQVNSKADLALLDRNYKRQHELAESGKFFDLFYSDIAHRVDPEAAKTFRRYKELENSSTQDWDKIVTAQQRKDAKKGLQEPEEAVREIAEDTRPEWQKNGWMSKDHPLGDPYKYEDFGKDLSEESKRDLFVVDSLAKHWANQINTGRLSNKRISDPWSRAEARHGYTNYDEMSRGFSKDVIEAIRNKDKTPGEAVQLKQRFKNNSPLLNKSVATLVLNPSEHPKYISNVRVFPDMAEGADLYEALFRTRADEKMNQANPQYWTLKDWRAR